MLGIGGWIFDPASRRLVAGREEQRLSPKAAAVLLALAETPRLVWSRDALLERVWPGVVVGEEVLTHAVAELRRALGDSFRAPDHVETVHKGGYRLICAVDRHTPDDAETDRADGEAWGGVEGAHFGFGTEFGLAAYARYLEARRLFERGGSSNTRRAVRIYNEVLADEPGFSLAHEGMSNALAFLAVYYTPHQADFEGAFSHCRAARRIAPRSAGALAAEGFLHAIAGRFDRALSCFRRSIWLNPDLGDTHYLIGRACFAELNVALAAPMFERAAALRPDDFHSLVLAGKARQIVGDEAQARRDFARALARAGPQLAADPDDHRALCGVTRCLVHLDREEEAFDVIERMPGLRDPFDYHLACTFARAGADERALDTLEQAIDGGWKHPAWLARDPDFDRLRGQARFQRLARSIAH